MKCDKPGCDHPHDIEVDLPEPKTIQGNIEPINQIQQAPQQTQLLQTAAPAPEPEKRKLSHDEIGELIPKGVNAISS